MKREVTICDFDCDRIATDVCPLCGKDACGGHLPFQFAVSFVVGREATQQEMTSMNVNGSGKLVITRHSNSSQFGEVCLATAGHHVFLCRDCARFIWNPAALHDPSALDGKQPLLKEALQKMLAEVRHDYAAAALAKSKG